MKRILFAILMLICTLGNTLFWPEPKPEPVLHESIRSSYDNICMITTSNSVASGVLLESGYILTAAHVVDQNMDGVLDDNEKHLKAHFASIDMEVEIEALAMGDLTWDDLDVAVLKPAQEIPLNGTRLMTDEEYQSLKIGTPISAIGMTNAVSPANISDGRIVNLDPDEHGHWSSASVFFGNSGGGAFVEDKLAGKLIVAKG